MAGRFKVETIFRAIDQMTAPVRRMEKGVGKFVQKIERGFKRMAFRVKKFAAGLKRMAFSGALSLTAFGLAMKNVILIGADFGRTIGSAAVRFPGQIKRGTAAFKALEDAAREAGRTTEFTATEAAQGLLFFAKAGFTANFAAKALKETIDFATAAEIEFAEAASFASDTLGAFNLRSVDADKQMTGLRRVMDTMTMAASSANMTVGDLFESISKGGPLANTAGASIETFAALTAVLANSSVKGSEAGTALRNGMMSLAGVGFEAKKVFGALNIALENNDGTLRDQLDVLDDLRGRWKGFSEQQRIAISNAIFGKRTIGAANIMLGEQGKEIRKLRKEYEAQTGASRKMAEFIRSDVRGSLDMMNSAIESVKLTLFSMNEGPLKDTIDKFTEWIRLNEQDIAQGITDGISKIVEGFKFIKDNRKEIVDTFVSIADAVTIAASGVIAIAKFFSKHSGIIKAFAPSVPHFDKEDILQQLETVSPQERNARLIEERRTTSTAEVTLTAGAGTSAEVTGGSLGPGLELAKTGDF